MGEDTRFYSVSMAELAQRIKDLQAENERLAKEKDEQYQAFQKWKKEYFTENARLRDALEKIANYPHPTFNGERVWTISDISMTTIIAKKALSAGENKGKE